LAAELAPYKNQRLIVLYSNGMTHPAQARDSLFRMGFSTVYFLTDGLKGFLETCLKPVSLRSEPVSEILSFKINAWRAFFLADDTEEDVSDVMIKTLEPTALIETDWLNANLKNPNLKVIDLRAQSEYNGGHIPGSLSLNPESLRGCINGVPSSLLPGDMLAKHFSLMGILPDDVLVLVYKDRIQDATLLAIACERLGHLRFGILQGGFAKWQGENRPLDTKLPVVAIATYPNPQESDRFTAVAADVLQMINDSGVVLIDIRPYDNYTGKKQDEARGGHIPGALNRPYSEDVVKVEYYNTFKPKAELEKAYASMIPDKETPVTLYCRTGHQASQTYFILSHLLGYTNVSWYDGGWTEWATKPEWPVQ
jgi:thiosulfate/3-mercaptopyruvate sulfurtransferase